MAAVTYGAIRATNVDTATAAPRRSWLARFFAAMMEARLHQAQREIRLYTRMIPPAGDQAPSAKSDSGAAPLGGW